MRFQSEHCYDFKLYLEICSKIYSEFLKNQPTLPYRRLTPGAAVMALLAETTNADALKAGCLTFTFKAFHQKVTRAAWPAVFY